MSFEEPTSKSDKYLKQKQLQKQPFLCTLTYLKFAKIEVESALRVEIEQTFFSMILESFSELEKNYVDFGENRFFAYFCYTSAIARDKDS